MLQVTRNTRQGYSLSPKQQGCLCQATHRFTRNQVQGVSQCPHSSHSAGLRTANYTGKYWIVDKATQTQ